MSPIAAKTLKGRVVKQPYAPDSKSEHPAVCLQDAQGQLYRLRLLDGESFSDPRLEALVGKSISAQGQVVHGTTLIVKEWTEIQ